MSDQQHRTSVTRRFTPWGAMGVSAIGIVAGGVISAAVSASDPSDVVITAVAVAVAFLVVHSDVLRGRGGARPVKREGGGVGVTDGTTTSDALPTSVSVGKGRTVSGAWSVDDADTVNFHFPVIVGG